MRDFGDGDRAGLVWRGFVSPERGALRICDLQFGSAVLAGSGSELPGCREMAGCEGGIRWTGEVCAGRGVGCISKSCEREARGNTAVRFTQGDLQGCHRWCYWP